MAQEARVRILLTDGTGTDDLFWVRHNGHHQVISGKPHAGWHVTYPRDGRVHLTWEKDVRRDFKRITEKRAFDGFTGHYQLAALSLPPRLGVAAPFRQTKDAIVMVDVRSLPVDRLLWIFVGLVAPGAEGGIEYDPPVDVHQFVLARTVTPWLYVAVGSAKTPDERLNLL